MTTASPGMALKRTWSNAGRSRRARSPTKSFAAPRIMVSGLAKSSMRIGVFSLRGARLLLNVDLSPRRLAVPDPDGLFLGAAQVFGIEVRTPTKTPRGGISRRGLNFFRLVRARV